MEFVGCKESGVLHDQDLIVATKSRIDHVPHGMIYFTQTDLLDLKTYVVLDNQEYETVIVSVMNHLDENGLIIDRVHENTMN